MSTDECAYQKLIKRHGLPDTVLEMALVYDVSESHYAFSRDVPDELVARFQKALDSILPTSAYRNLANHYLH